MAREKHGAFKMVEFDLLRTLTIRNTLRNKALRSARCDCVLKPFKNVEDSNFLLHQQHPENDRLEIVRSILTCSDENLFSSVSILFSDWLSSIHNCNNSSSNNNVVQELILPLYWLSSSPFLRVEILTFLLENLDHRAKRISLPMEIAHGAVGFAESICDCVCSSKNVEKGKENSCENGDGFDFSVFSDEEAALLEMFVTQVCRLLDNQTSNEDIAMNCDDDGYISKRNKNDSKYEDSSHGKQHQKAVVVNSEDDDAFVASTTINKFQSSRQASSSIISGFTEKLPSSCIATASSASNIANKNNVAESQSSFAKVNEDVAESKPRVSANNLREGNSGGLFESTVSALYAALSQACNTIDLSF